MMAMLNKQRGKSSNLVRSEELELLWLKKPMPLTWYYEDQGLPGEVAGICTEDLGIDDQQSGGITSQK